MNDDSQPMSMSFSYWLLWVVPKKPIFSYSASFFKVVAALELRLQHWYVFTVAFVEQILAYGLECLHGYLENAWLFAGDARLNPVGVLFVVYPFFAHECTNWVAS